MNKPINAVASVILLFGSTSITAEEARQLVQLPEMMQQQMMSNMRDHLVAINEILINMANGEPEKAAEVAGSL